MKPKTSSKHKKTRKPEEVLPTTVNTLLYQGLFPNGLMQVTPDYFSQSYLLGDVNYQTVGLEDKGAIMETYSDLINSLDDKTNFQLTIFNQRVNLDKFRKGVLYPLHEDGYDTYREELNRIMENNLEAGENNFSAVKFISFGKSDQNPKLAYRSLSQIGEYFKSGFSEIDANFTLLSGEGRVNHLADMLRGENHLPFTYQDLVRSGQTTKHFIAPTSLSFKHKNHIEMDDKLLQIVYVRDYGMELGDKFLRELMQSDLEVMISLHAKGSAKSEAMTKLRTKKTLMESQKIGEQQKMARSGVYLEKVSQVLESNIDEADELIKTMTQTGDKLFNTLFLIGVFADNEDQLKHSLDIIKQVAGSNDLVIDNLTYMQEAAFNSLLPFGKNYLEGVSRSLLTSNIAVNSPWTSVDLQDKGGKFYGINQISSNIITIDRGKLNTPSGLILGTSGAGKGMATKHEIISTKLKEAESDTEIIIVDPENEYSIIGQAFGGESIDIAPDSTTFLNVLDLSDDNMDEDPIKVKSEFLLSWIGKLLDRKMDGREKSLIDRVTRLTYKHFETPSLVEWVFVLSKQPEQEAKDLALDMELYVEGSLDIFSHRTNIKTDSHFLIYNVKKLGDELKQIALMVIFDQIWNRVVKNQKLGKKTWIYFDEMQLLLLDKYASDFFFKLWSRVRKYGAIPTGITQNVETLLLDANGRRIIANSEFMILLKQAKSDREELVHLLGLSKELEKYLVNPEKGAGLIKAGSTVVPFRNKIPLQTQLFDIMSTDPEKMRAEQ
ncbi:AAA family ATPase [Streptococcus agalactiae]|nr:ATPase AAA [Streptococcus agalactiae MRI Z1-039]EPW91666.1 ATPase AAA [Streptococcus agalactiae MRI Z1-025]EPW96004.1 ATPase AAA [Streptococcus agalactiae MRI Z1-022]EPX02325.1 ATPase AAA [Streptococcus agalactiae MRI Z1-049]EQA91391.1 ATPase AAA [Streptococcus agalactiae MRI Z1-038]TQB90599.1 AAA family ATPase [Streptococcus agalactiae]